MYRRLALVIMALIGSLAAQQAAAVDPQLLLTQYAHRSWAIGFNGLNTDPDAIVQDHDGYLVLGAQDGLYRFNGERFQPWQPWRNISRKLNYVYNIFYARDGSLYIFGLGYVARYKDGKIYFFKETALPLMYFQNWFGRIFEDDSGRIWIVQYDRSKDPNPFCHVDGDHIVCQDTLPGGLCSDEIGGAPGPQGGVMWFATRKVCNVSKTGRENHLDYPGGTWAEWAGAVSDHAGHLDVMLVTPKRDFYLETDGHGWKPIPGGAKVHKGRVIFRDREGAIWIGSYSQGLWRLFNGRVEHYTHADGLSGNSISAIFQDKEGSVWVTTDQGVDQFRAPTVVRYAAREGLSGDQPTDPFVTRSGDLWVPNSNGVDAFRHGQIVTPSPHVSPRKNVFTIVQDTENRIWSRVNGKGIFYGNDQTPVRNALNVDLRFPQDLIATPEGSVWTGGTVRHGKSSLGALVQLRAGRVVGVFPTPASVDYAPIAKLAPDGNGFLWVTLYDRDGVLLFRNGGFSKLRGPDNASGYAMAPAEPGATWMAAFDGLYHVKAGGAIRRLGTAEGLPCQSFFALTKASNGDIWLKSDCGLLHIDKQALAAFLAGHGGKLHVDRIDVADGAPISSLVARAVSTPDGKVWFPDYGGLFMVDTKARVQARQPIPTMIDDIVADGKSFLSGRRSPTLPRRIEINFSGIDFQRPDRLSFRYVLSRRMREWRGDTAERSVSFTDLGPGTYVFSIVACENGTLCSRKSATLAFEIPPTFTQTWMFKVTLTFLAALTVWIAYRVWHRRVTLDIQRRTEARLGERERIARDLHDTLLQGFQGLLLRLQGVANVLSRGDPVREGLESALDRGEQIIVEGRDRVRELRVDESGLPEILQKFVDDASLDCDAKIELEIQGTPRELRPGIANEIGQIVREAVANACRHAEASHIVVTAEFGRRQLSVRVVDDGKGMPAQPPELSGVPHFGLSGMRERAKRLKATFMIESAGGTGTEVFVSITASVACLNKSRARAIRAAWVERLFARLAKSFRPSSRGKSST